MTFTSTTTISENHGRHRIKKCVSKMSIKKQMMKRFPIIEWLPKYQIAYLIQDIIAGITVGLTAIPQGIAYAVIAGLPPEHGLYASLTSGVVYVFFGSRFNVTVGPTAILAALIARYVSNYSVDFAILTAFLTGVVVLVMGLLNLGFLVEFISMPVISGFTIAAALQIAAAQLKSLFGLSGASGDLFTESVHNFFINIKTMKLWDPMLGFSTVIMLVLLQKMGHGCSRTDNFVKQIRWFVSLSRNAVVVIVGMIITYILKITLNTEPLNIVGAIGGGLPKFGWPPFTTVVGNGTYTFTDMLAILGPQSLAIPFVALLELVAIAKAFSDGDTIDATQEMIALGLCNIIGSFGQSMPITGSFTRTALNHVSGVQTPAGGVTKVLLIIVALTYLTSTFYFIPKASLAGLIIVAMFAMVDFGIIVNLWKNSKREFFVLISTMIVSLFAGLEYGILTGISLEAFILLYKSSRPPVDVNVVKSQHANLKVVQLSHNLSYCAAEHVRRAVLRASQHALTETLIVIDGTNLRNPDYTVASNLMSVVKQLGNKSLDIVLLNFRLDIKNLCVAIDQTSEPKFMYAANAEELLDTMTKHA